jgi:hypothetical protein
MCECVKYYYFTKYYIKVLDVEYSNMIVIDSNFKNDDEYCKMIYVNNNSLSKELCYEFISKFNAESGKYKGVTLGGVNVNIKDTYDYVIKPNEEVWKQYCSTLRDELEFNIHEYNKQVNDVEDYKQKYNNTTVSDYKIGSVSFDNLTIDTFMIQRYNKNEGRYTYHNDYVNDQRRKKMRILTFIFYLNDVEVGGETTFSGRYQIKPQTGKLVIFPASWTFPHCGKMPISDNKYIITGWLYEDWTDP